MPPARAAHAARAGIAGARGRFRRVPSHARSEDRQLFRQSLCAAFGTSGPPPATGTNKEFAVRPALFTMKLIDRHVWNNRPSGSIHQSKIRREAQARFGFQFERRFLIFSRENRPEKNREISDILNSRNMLSARCLQTTLILVFTNNLENLKNESSKSDQALRLGSRVAAMPRKVKDLLNKVIIGPLSLPIAPIFLDPAVFIKFKPIFDGVCPNKITIRRKTKSIY